MTLSKTLLTADDLLKLPDDGQRYELVRGELQTMVPAGGRHGQITANLVYLLNAHVKPNNLGIVTAGEAGFFTQREPDTVRVPDVAFYARQRIPPSGVPEGFWEIPPDLTIEIISPSEKATDVQSKVEEYLAAGVKLIWLVYPRTHSVVEYRSLANIRTLTVEDVLDGADVLPRFACPVADIFS